MDASSREVFCDPRIRRRTALKYLCGSVLSFWVVSQMTRHTTRLVDAYMGVVVLVGLGCLVAAIRALRGGIFLDERGVTVRTTFSTRSWRWEQLRHATTRDRISQRSPMTNIRVHKERTQVLPALQLASGKYVELHGLRIVLQSPELANWVDDGIQEIDRRLDARRRSDGAATRA